MVCLSSFWPCTELGNKSLVHGLDVAVSVRSGAIKLMMWFAFAQLGIKNSNLYVLDAVVGFGCWGVSGVFPVQSHSPFLLAHFLDGH